MLMLFGYVTLRSWQALQSVGNIKVYFLVASVALFLSIFASMIFGNNMNPIFAKIISFAGFSYMLFVIYMLFAFLLVDIVRIANTIFHFGPTGLMTFRYYAFLASVFVVFVTMAVGHYKFRNPEIVNLNIQSDKPLQGKEVKIVAVSDLHFGISIDKAYAKRYVELINTQNPDIVLIAGDFSDRGITPLIKQNMKEEFMKIKAPLGIYSVMGNHDFYGENRHIAADYMKECGINVLRDTVSLINNEFYIAGRDDLSNSGRKSLFDVLQNTDKTRPIVLLDHQPSHLNDAVTNNVDLQISGHTHNGQFFPGSLFVKRIFEHGYGYLKKGKTHFYVSSGLGLWGPQYRIGTQSELVVIKFRY